MKEYFIKVEQWKVEQWWDKLNTIIIIGYKEGKEIYILHGENFDKYDFSERIVPTLSIPYIFDKEQNILNQLVDGLIEQGAKPSKPIKNNEELVAIKYHLEDMRKLIFKKDGTE